MTDHGLVAGVTFAAADRLLLPEVCVYDLEDHEGGRHPSEAMGAVRVFKSQYERLHHGQNPFENRLAYRLQANTSMSVPKE